MGWNPAELLPHGACSMETLGDMTMTRVAVLDDYQDVALQMADWNVLPPDTRENRSG
jgi:hypothetical protein